MGHISVNLTTEQFDLLAGEVLADLDDRELADGLALQISDSKAMGPIVPVYFGDYAEPAETALRDWAKKTADSGEADAAEKAELACDAADRIATRS